MIAMDVAIIGAGIAGLSTALTLHSRGIQCVVYESLLAPQAGYGALMLAPNALRILDGLKLYSNLQRAGFNFDTVEFRNEGDELLDSWQMGNSERYSYQALRITRRAFLGILRQAVSDRGIEVRYGQKFSQVVSESAGSVVFELASGEQVTSSILIGAGGIYSKVRSYVAPDIEATYSGMLALVATVDHRFRAASSATTSYPQTTFYNDSSGCAMLAMPQSHDGGQLCLGKQVKYPEQNREDWVHLSYNQDRLYDLFMHGTETWPMRIRKGLDLVKKENIHIWPFYAVPDLPSWTSLPHRRIIVIGDAAHSMPPTAGQGACQAIEDAYTLALVIAMTSRFAHSSDSYRKSIETWEAARKERVKRASLFTKQLDNNKLPLGDRIKLPEGTYWKDGEKEDLTWLYGSGLANARANTAPSRIAVDNEPDEGRMRVRSATVA